MKRDFKILVLLILGASLYSYIKFNSRKTSDEYAREFIAEARKSGGNFSLPIQNPLIGRIDSLIAYQKYSEALEIIDTAHIMEETKPNYKGKIFFKQGKMQESINLFTRAIDSGDKISIYFADRAEVYLSKKQTTRQCIKIFQTFFKTLSR